MADEEKKRVCVTGAGGYLASWLVKLLLSNGYFVHGTVRNPDEKKNAHLYELDGASENLRLFKADLLDQDSLRSAIQGCAGVFHVASPLPSNHAGIENPEKELIEPAVKGTFNVLQACLEENVKRVIVVSSGAAVSMNPNWPKDQAMDETCWSDADFQKSQKSWYPLSKTLAEREAVEFGKRTGLDVVRVCPVLVLGPMLQRTVNASSLFLIRLLKGGNESTDDRLMKIVDVRDAAKSLLLAYEKPAAEGRYISASHMIKSGDLMAKLRTLYPQYSYPRSFNKVDEGPNLTSEKMQKLGWKFRTLEETLIDSVACYRDAGLLD
ncbi:cinnamoyl-CoA reductase 1-like isoform X2 [Punica granatum]|uniref:Cinnamoyl-CoA reductase 1-like isoform X2 n=1 Tax=Punica granatum TaxID=22663 RepID=A0A6P8E261_PUNGR|nr:cinnamoyl-CoA reductase 1-like isoform X2 [Punica granatum]